MDKQTFDTGLEIRKSVLGAEFVDNAIKSADDFNRPLQELVTEYCWGTVWNSDDVERKTRSLINIAMLTALNRNHELGVHVRGALNNGATVQEIQGVLMQTAIYVGVPAALESFRVAERVLREVDGHA